MYRNPRVRSRKSNRHHAVQATSFQALIIMFLVLLTGTAVGAAEKESEGYPRRQLLAEVADLSPAPGRELPVILDTRELEAFQAGRIPGAVWVDVAVWGRDVSQESEAAVWTDRISALGINFDSEIIIYDDHRQRNASRTWWILRSWGVSQPRILNGGWASYVASGKPVESGPAVPTQKGEFTARANERVTATKSLLLKNLVSETSTDTPSEPKLQLVDTRSHDEFCGTQVGRNKRSGTISGSKHLEWSQLLEPESSRFRSAEELRNLLREAGIDIQRPAVTFCQGGGRASVMAFGLELMGSTEARNYYPGWGEWGNADDTPVERPDGAVKPQQSK